MLKKYLSVLLLCCFFGTMQAQKSGKEPVPVPAVADAYALSDIIPKAVVPQGSEEWIGYWKNDPADQLRSWGRGEVPAKYSAAACWIINSAELIGKTVEGIRMKCADSPYLSHMKVWLARILPETPEEADICCQDVPLTEVGTLTEVRFDTPYKVNSKNPLFAGYSFEITGGDTEAEYRPLLFADGPENDKACYVKMGDDVVWGNYNRNFGLLALQLLVSGESPAKYVIMDRFPDDQIVEGTELSMSLDCTNIGSDPVENLTFSADFGQGERLYEVTLPRPALQGEAFKAELNLTVPAEPKDYTLVLKINRINGQTVNQDIKSVVNVTVVSHRALRTVAMEEYSGMWCGFCPRGLAAMEKLKPLFGEQLVILAAHSDDALATEDYLPLLNTVSRYPSANLNRLYNNLDAYSGYGTPFGIVDAIRTAAKDIAVAVIESKPTLDGDVVTARAEVEFLYTGYAGYYAIAYVLTEDDMHDPAWKQRNYLSGDQSYVQEDPMFAPWVNAESVCSDVVYDDVVIAACEPAYGIAGSIPDYVKAGEKITHEVTFNLNDYPLIKDRSKLKVTALLLQKYQTVIQNADCQRVSQNTGIEEIVPEDERDIVTGYYSVDGRRLKGPQRGVNLVKYANGQVRKVILN